MGYSSKFKSVRNSTALTVVFAAWYLSASLTVVIMENRLAQVAQLTTDVFLCVLAFMSLMFLVSHVLRRTDVVDAAWGPAFVVAAMAAFLLNPYDVSLGLNVQTLVSVLVTIWALRLSVSITRRLLRKPEDSRYVELRKNWKGNPAVNTYLRIFLTQAILATLISSAVIHINLSMEEPIGLIAYVGASVWLIGFFFEAVGDLQLKRFLSQPSNRGKLMTEGLWRYTRHPNYFGEATMWWGIFIIALSVPNGWLGAVTPVIITYLLLFVSGVPMTEKAFAGKPGWKAYERRTSKFIPLPPRQQA